MSAKATYRSHLLRMCLTCHLYTVYLWLVNMVVSNHSRMSAKATCPSGEEGGKNTSANLADKRRRQRSCPGY